MLLRCRDRQLGGPASWDGAAEKGVFRLGPDPPVTDMVLVRFSDRLPKERGQSIDSFDNNLARNKKGNGGGGNIGVPWGRGGRQRTGTRDSRTGSAASDLQAAVKSNQIKSNRV